MSKLWVTLKHFAGETFSVDELSILTQRNNLFAQWGMEKQQSQKPHTFLSFLWINTQNVRCVGFACWRWRNVDSLRCLVFWFPSGVVNRYLEFFCLSSTRLGLWEADKNLFGNEDVPSLEVNDLDDAKTKLNSVTPMIPFCTKLSKLGSNYSTYLLTNLFCLNVIRNINHGRFARIALEMFESHCQRESARALKPFEILKASQTFSKRKWKAEKNPTRR